MSLILDKNRPICPQIEEYICVKIAFGYFKGEDKLPSVREVALMAGVNPNTVQRSFEHLEQKGIIYSVQGLGCFASSQTELALNEVRRIAEDKTSSYFSQMKSIGFSSEEIKNYVKEWQE